jgi:hypothetical protein
MKKDRPEIVVSNKNFTGMTQFRRGTIIDDIQNGIIKEGSLRKSSLGTQMPTPPSSVADPIRSPWKESGGKQIPTPMPIGGSTAIVHSASYLEKSGLSKIGSISSVGSTGMGSSGSSQSDYERMAPEIYSPLYTIANLNLPRDRVTINAWCRTFFQLHPIVRNAVTLHATYPIGKINIKCSDKKKGQFFEDMIEEMDLLTSLGEVALEFWKIGEVFPFAEFNEENGKWSKIIVQNPDYVMVQKSSVPSEPMISLKPDKNLISLINSNDPSKIRLKKQLTENVINCVKKGQNIPLDNFNISHLKMLSSPYDIHGTSIIVSVFKDLMLWDKLRESKFAQADGMINPMTLITLGGSSDGEYRATDKDLQEFRQIMEEAQFDKDAKIVSHAGVKIERVGYSGHTIDIAADLELIIKNIYTGLMIPPAIVDSDSSAYASASIGLEVLRQRYFNFRNIMERWLINKIFAPISEVQDFYKYVDGEKVLIVPEIEWNKMNLYDLQDYIGNISSLVSNKQASIQTLYKSLGLNYEDEQVKMRKERIDMAIAEREEQALREMSLFELRALNPEKPISEPVDEKQRKQEGGGGGDIGDLSELAAPPGGMSPPGGAGAPSEGGVTPPLGPGTGV